MLVFDIQRFCVNDGPGVRSTVFLKGCPLTCPWCHNPESNSYKPQLGFFADKCVGCGACVSACPRGAHRFDEEGRHRVDFDKCVGCGACVASCPATALKLYGQEMSLEEIFAELERDDDYYEVGGGITVSGGEAMSRFGDTEAILREAQRRGWDTCVETSGFGKPEHYRKLASLATHVLFDYKVTGAGRYEELIGISEEQVLANLDELLGAGGSVILRCPIVPGYSDDPEHFAAIAALSRRAGIEGVELLPYHDFGVAKAKAVGSSQYLDGVPMASPEAPDAWIEAIEALGGIHISLG